MRKRIVFKSLLSILLVITMLVPNFIFPVFAAGNNVEEDAVNTDNIVLNKKTVATDDPEIFRIDLETYAKGALVTNVESADIVLILDTSGSMNNSYSDYAIIEDASYIKESSNTYYIFKDGKYAKLDHYSQRKVNGVVVREEGWYVYQTPSSSIVTADKIKFRLGGTGVNNEYQFYSTEKVDALKHSVTLFIDKLYSFTQTYDVDFRIAAVTFSDTSKVLTGSGKDNAAAYVSVKTGAKALKSAIWGLKASGDTYPGYATDDALNIVKDGYQKEKHLFVVMFSDGVASSTSTTTGSYAAVSDAHEMKNTYGASVYTIGVFDDLPSETSAVYYMLNGISSNYPDATKPTKSGLGTKKSSEYYIPATDFDGLDSAFDRITNAVGTPFEDLVVKDVVTQYFYLTDAQKAAITNAYPNQIELVDRQDGTTEIKIKNMDFPIVLCDDDGNPLNPNDPGIFRFSFYITIKEEFAGGNQVPTNTTDSGIYTEEDNELLEYPVPDVDIPIKYDIDAHDISIYVGDTVKPSDIFTNEDGKWMADLVHIEYTVKDSNGNEFKDITALNDNETYTITATVTPKHAGDFKEVSFTKTATVNVFDPTITFTKDFTIYKGEKADISKNYTVKWTCPDNLNAAMPEGTAPTVLLTLKDKNGNIADPSVYGPVTADKTVVDYGINSVDVKADNDLLSPADYTIVSVKNTPVTGSNFTVSVKPNLITYDLDGGKMSGNPDQYTYGIGVTSFNPAAKIGYDFLHWQDAKTGEIISSIPKTAKGDYSLKAIYAAKVDTKYLVNHYTENLDGSWKLEANEELKGETDTTATAQARVFSGFSFNAEKSTTKGVIKADGSLILNLYYTRNEHDLNIIYRMSDGTTPPDNYSVTLYYNEEYKVESPLIPGYTADKKVVEGTMPDGSVREIVTYTPNADTKYVVKHFTESLDGTWKLEETDKCTGTTNTTVNADINDYLGFTVDQSLGKLSGTVAGDGSLVLEVYYRRNRHNLKVDYQMSDGTDAPDDYSATLKFGESYSVTTPIVPGYTPDKGTVKGTMPDKDVAEKVIYTPNPDTPYTVKHYTEGLDGTWKLEETEYLTNTTNTTVAVDPNTYTGFTLDENLGKLSGKVLADGSLLLEAYYTRNKYDLTVEYEMSDGTKAPETYTGKVKYQDEYSVTTPVVPGYTPSKVVVEGTMPADNLTEKVVYTPNADTKYTVYHYTENLDGTWKLEATENLVGTTNTIANVTPKTFSGYTFDPTLGTLSGTIAGDGSLVLKAYYTRNEYKLNVKYEMSDKTQAPDEYKDTLKYEDEYSVTSPDVLGYTPDKSVVAGKMPADDVVEIVVYTPNSDTKYKVLHYTENLDGTWNLEVTEELEGITNTVATVVARDFTGFTFDENLGILSGTIKPDGSLVLKAYYVRNQYNVTVTYKTSDGTEAPEKYVTVLKYGETYSVESPDVLGYTPDRFIVEGTVPANDVSEEVVYTPNSNTPYKVLHFTENLDGTWKLVETENLQGTTNTTADATPNVYTGFTFDENLGILSGNIAADGSLVLKVYYTRNSYDLVIEYIMSDGTTAPEKYTATLKYEEGYSVNSPDIIGYTADRLLVEGVMPAENVAERVIYTPNADTKYTVLHYTENLDGTWTLVDTENLVGTTNTTANAVPKEYTGFTFDETLGKLSGNIEADGSLVLEVYYTRNSYNVTVTYKMSDGTEAPEKYVTVLKYGETYSVESPDVLGYTPDRALVEGTVPANDVSEEVVYTPNSNTPYKVLHFTENLDGTWKLVETENFVGTTNTTATALPKEYTGFTFDETLGKLNGNIEADGSLALEAYYTRNSYDLTVEYVMADGTTAPEKYTATLKYEEGYSVTSPDIIGYTADRVLVEGTMPADSVTERVVYTPNDDTAYKVLHYTENLDGTWALVETENLQGTTNTTATAVPKEFIGFTFDETLGKLSGNIEADGSLVLEVYYTRNIYTITYVSDGSVYDIKQYKFGDTILPVPDPKKDGHKFVRWDNLPKTMPAEDITVIAVYESLPKVPASDNNTPDINNGDPSIPKTGIEYNFAAFIAVFMLAMLMMVVLIKKHPEES